jgi:APA family basic amino acid/polyamine antiporter
VKIFFCPVEFFIALFYLGIVCAMFAAVFPLGILGEMTSIGTLVAFFLVHVAVIIVSLW